MKDAGPAMVAPTLRFMLSHPAHVLALGLGSGLVPVAPGTVGTLLAFPLHFALAAALPPSGVLVIVALLFAAGIWACERTGAALGVPDHGGMVWDEIVAFMLVLVFTPPGPLWQVLAFLAFRFFDIAKPPPIRAIDRDWKGGLGVMVDDIVAAFYSVVVIAIVKRLVA